MAAVIIRKKNLEQLGKKVIKEVYKFLHDEYILNNFAEMNLEKQRLEKYLVIYNFQNYNFTIKQESNSWSIDYGDFDKTQHEDELKKIEDKIENESLDITVIFKVLNKIKLCNEINEDLYEKTKSFLNIYKVFEVEYSYLED